MADKQFDELCVEVGRHRRIAKPIRTRPIPGSDMLEIVDGEHNWKAAKEVGLAKVPCVIEDLDEAIALHNGVPQGLSSSIFTKNLLEAEQFLSAALEQDPSLLEDALANKVILATPSSVVAQSAARKQPGHWLAGSLAS